MTQSELARRVGVSRSLVNKIEIGERQVGHAILPAFCKATRLTARDLRPDLVKAVRSVLRR